MAQDCFVANPRLLQVLQSRAIAIDCPENKTLFRQGDAPEGIYLVLKGDAVLLMTSDATNVIVNFSAPAGSVLGIPAAVGNSEFSLTAIARKGSQIGFVKLALFRELLQQNPTLYPEVLEILASEVRAARSALTDLKHSSFAPIRSATLN